MTEPHRLLEEGTRFERTLLASANDDRPSPARRRRAIAAIAAGTTPLVTAAGASAALAPWKVLAIVAAAAGVGVAVVRGVDGPADRPSAVVSQPPAAVAASHLPPPPGAAPTTAALPVESATVVAPDPTLVSPAKATPPPAPAKAAPAASSAAPALSHEIQLIDAARQAIEAGDPTSAIAALDRYQRECPTGVLALEAQVLRIEAIARSGDPAGAAQLARRFLEGHPDSPYEARVRKHLPGEP